MFISSYIEGNLSMFVGRYKALDRQTDTIQFYYTDFAMKSQTCTEGDQLYDTP